MAQIEEGQSYGGSVVAQHPDRALADELQGRAEAAEVRLIELETETERYRRIRNGCRAALNELLGDEQQAAPAAFDSVGRIA